jgi:hypothetical protein
MDRRIGLWAAAGLVVASLAVAPGCNPWKKHGVRANPQTEERVSYQVDELSRSHPDDVQDKFKANFFPNNRNQGTWSSEAREVESSLGVMR